MPASAAILIQSSWQELAQGRTLNPCPPTPLQNGKLHTRHTTMPGAPCPWAETA